MKTEKAAYRELGIRKVIRELATGNDVAGFDGRTVAAARCRLAKKFPALPLGMTDKQTGGKCTILCWLSSSVGLPEVRVMFADNSVGTINSSRLY